MELCRTVGNGHPAGCRSRYRNLTPHFSSLPERAVLLGKGESIREWH
jgi:hypothetical protein